MKEFIDHWERWVEDAVQDQKRRSPEIALDMQRFVERTELVMQKRGTPLPKRSHRFTPEKLWPGYSTERSEGSSARLSPGRWQFNPAKWKAANPKGDVDAAIRTAKARGYPIVGELKEEVQVDGLRGHICVQESRAETHPKKPRPTVLVVDDERVITDTLAMILTLRGYESSAAYNGWTGLQRARDIKPAMILSGVKNGDGPNGIEMAILVREEMPGTRILLVSGMAALLDPLLEDARARGHNLDLVAKPVIPQVLLHWCDLGGNHDVCSCQWCREQRVTSGGAYPHGGDPTACRCPWCRALTKGSRDG
jgi:CheY-like chemotaxis protein